MGAAVEVAELRVADGPDVPFHEALLPGSDIRQGGSVEDEAGFRRIAADSMRPVGTVAFSTPEHLPAHPSGLRHIQYRSALMDGCLAETGLAVCPA